MTTSQLADADLKSRTAQAMRTLLPTFHQINRQLTQMPDPSLAEKIQGSLIANQIGVSVTRNGDLLIQVAGSGGRNDWLRYDKINRILLATEPVPQSKPSATDDVDDSRNSQFTTDEWFNELESTLFGIVTTSGSWPNPNQDYADVRTWLSLTNRITHTAIRLEQWLEHGPRSLAGRRQLGAILVSTDCTLTSEVQKNEDGLLLGDCVLSWEATGNANLLKCKTISTPDRNHWNTTGHQLRIAAPQIRAWIKFCKFSPGGHGALALNDSARIALEASRHLHQQNHGKKGTLPSEKRWTKLFKAIGESEAWNDMEPGTEFPDTMPWLRVQPAPEYTTATGTEST